jgi:hypothetical protein
MILSIHSAYFSTHADYQEGKALLLFLLGTDEAEEAVEIRMSVGADWATADGGKTITHPTKKVQKINKNSIYGHWIEHCFQIPALTEELISRNLPPTAAAVWDGLILHLQLREISFGRNIDPQTRLMPTEYLGLTSELEPITIQVATPTTAPVPAPAPATPASAPVLTPKQRIEAAKAAATQATAASNGSPLYAEMVELAKSSSDFATFLNAALAREEVLADDALAEQVADETKLWASVH